MVPDALPGSTLGNHVLVLSAWLHDGLGNTLSQIVEVFNCALRRLVADAIRLWRARADMPEETYASRRPRLAARLQELLAAPWRDRHAKRLIKRLRRHQNDLFTFLDQFDVPFDNNTATILSEPSSMPWQLT